MENRSFRSLLRLSAFFVACGCSGQSFGTKGSSPSNEAGDAALPTSGPDGAMATGGQPTGAGGQPTGSGGAGGAGGARATGGVGGAHPASGGALATGGAATATGGTSSTGGAQATGDAGDAGEACTPVTHDNGLGQTWQDCVPLGTYDESQAIKACEASGAASCRTVAACGPSLLEVRGYSSDSSTIVGRWGYEGALVGYVGTGALGELCLGSSDPNNRTWR